MLSTDKDRADKESRFCIVELYVNLIVSTNIMTVLWKDTTIKVEMMKYKQNIVNVYCSKVRRLNQSIFKLINMHWPIAAVVNWFFIFNPCFASTAPSKFINVKTSWFKCTILNCLLFACSPLIMQIKCGRRHSQSTMWRFSYSQTFWVGGQVVSKLIYNIYCVYMTMHVYEL